MFHIRREGQEPKESASPSLLQAMGIEHYEREPEQYADAATAARKACVLSAMHGVDCEVIQQRESDRVVIARASRGVVTNVTPPPEKPKPTPFDQLNKNLTNLANKISEKL